MLGRCVLVSQYGTQNDTTRNMKDRTMNPITKNRSNREDEGFKTCCLSMFSIQPIPYSLCQIPICDCTGNVIYVYS